MLEAEAEAQRALARLADTRAECNKHKVITVKFEAMQNSVIVRANNQQQTMQYAKVDDVGYRLEEMKDLFPHCELRMEVQMAELNTKMHTLSTADHSEDQPKLDTPTASDIKVVPARTPDRPLMLIVSPKR